MSTVAAGAPTPFGKYELISRLAAGGMAEIFLARTRSIQGFEKYLVIKRILRHRTSDPEFVRMFLDEARVAATLDHPNIVQIYDVGHVENEYFIAMEYLRGHNLIELVRAGAKLGYSKPPLEHVMSMVSGVCAGLHYAHEKRDFQGRSLEIVHRDITPQNLVITFDGAVKVVDFGIAKAATREVETLAGTLKGKIGYMSPEQCRGTEIDRRSDVFAVGIILYELTTGKRLYHERSDFETLKKIIEGPVPSPRDLLPFYPAALNTIVVRCLQKSPADRYQSARELHADLDSFARDNQLVTGTVPLAQFMERLFAEELAAAKSDATAGPMPMPLPSGGSSPSYLGEQSRRSSQIARPLDKARRQHLAVRTMQLGTLLLIGATIGLGVWYKSRAPTVNAPPPIAAAPAPTPPATPRPSVPSIEPPPLPPTSPDPSAPSTRTPHRKLAVAAAPGTVTEAPPAVTEAQPAVTEAHPAVTEPQPAVIEAQPAVIEAPPAVIEAPPAVTEVRPKIAPPSGPPRMVASFVLDAQKLSAPQPHLPDFVTARESGKRLVGTYQICVDRDGSVYEVKTVASISGADAAIMSTLRTWKYRPQTGHVCGAKVLTFQVP